MFLLGMSKGYNRDIGYIKMGQMTTNMISGSENCVWGCISRGYDERAMEKPAVNPGPGPIWGGDDYRTTLW